MKLFLQTRWTERNEFSSFQRLFILLLLLTLSACSQVESEFQFSELTDGLAPAAKSTVQSTLVQEFGSPSEPKIPWYLPINRGGVVGEISTIERPETGHSIIGIDWKSDPPESSTGQLELLLDPEDAFDITMEALDEELPDPLAEINQLEITKAQDGAYTLNQVLAEQIEEGTEVALHPNKILKQGGQLYAVHCLHCHGVSGDGQGPTAQYMTPKPRDYRLGLFKFTSTAPQKKASHADLKGILQEGIPGTYMPSFKMLSSDDLDQLVDYIRYLAMRGEVEKNLSLEVGLDFSQEVIDEIVEDAKAEEDLAEEMADFQEDMEEFLKFDYPEIKLDVLMSTGEDWLEADEEDTKLFPKVARTNPHGPSAADPTKSSLENGRLLYLGNVAQCASCHGDAGRGDGYQTKQFQKKPDGSEYDIVGLHDTWGNPIAPRNLREDIYRGGRRPIDVFRRIYAGIKGTPMPVFGGKALSDEQIWDIVNYVMAMPYETDIPKSTPAEATSQMSPWTSKTVVTQYQSASPGGTAK